MRSDTTIMSWAAFGALCGIGLLLGFFKDFRRYLIVRRAQRSKIASSAMGFVEVKAHGVKAAEEVLLSPVTQSPCLYFRYRVLERRQNGKSSSWVEVHREDSSHIPFLIRDETGEVWVYPAACELYTYHKQVIHGGQYTLRAREALTRLGRFNWAMTSDRYRLEEEFLAPGDALYALGALYQTQDYLREEYAGLLREQIVRLKGDAKLMNRVDQNKDGEISHQEWDWARDRLSTLVHEHLENTRGTRILAADVRAPFILSNLAEGSLTSQFQFFAIVKLVTGAALFWGASWYLAITLL